MKRWIAIGVCVLGALVVWWWHGRDRADPSHHAAKTGSAVREVAPARAGEKADGAHLAITVTGPAGPIDGATVRLAHEDDEPIVLRTGKDGVAKSGDLAAGTWKIGASADGHAPASAKRELAAGETGAVAIALAAGGRKLAGTVTDASGGPIAGARIDAARLGGTARPSDAVATTVTGGDGKYAVTVAEGELLVAASDPDYAPQSRYVEVGAAGATADFQLVPGGVIEGVVRDEHTKQPVAGAEVEARRDAPAMMLGEVARRGATAGGDGRFRIGGLRPGMYELGAHTASATTRAPTRVGLGVAEQVSNVEILIGAGPVVRGTIVDEAGTPVAGSIEIEGQRTGRLEDTDKRGAFAVTGLAPGHYTLRGHADDFVPAASPDVELADKDVDGVRVVVRRGVKIKGHVDPRQICDVSAETEGVRGASVFEPTTTAADGEFTFGPADNGAVTLAARCPSGDQGSLEIHVAPGLAEQIVKVTPGGSIAGHVVDGAGKPVAGVTVMAAPQDKGDRTTIVNGVVTSGVQAITTGAGTYEVRGLAAGTYDVHALDRGKPLPTKTEAHVALGAAEHKTGIDLSVERADGLIRGTVTGADGKPLADAWVSVHQELEDMLASMSPHDTGSHTITIENTDDGANEAAPALTDAAGHFELGGLPRVPWTVVAEAQAGKLRARQGGVKPDATITLQALGVASLSGTVHAPGPITSFSVELDGPTRAQRGFANADGTFAFASVDAGAYTVRVTSPAGNGEATVTVVGGQPATVDITLASNAVVIGKLVDPSGKPIVGAPVTTVPDAGNGKVSVSLEGPPPLTGADGGFRVEGKAGKAALVVLRDPTFVRPGLVLVAGQTLDLGTITVSAGPPHGP